MKYLVLAVVLAVSAPLWARQGQGDRWPAGAYFRFTTADGVVHLERTLTREAMGVGYQVIDSNGRVVETVEGVALGDEEARQRRLAKARQEREDKELLRLYAGPDDAVRARDRKLDALELNISYEENNLAQLQMKLEDEVAIAARSERAGKPVPEGVQEAVDRLKRQIATSEGKLASYEQEIDEANSEYAPIIKRLEEIEKEKK